ncbi:MAG: NADP-dependent oxidoreductase [Acidobacteriota bacterium]
MKAIRVHRFGGPESLTWEAVPRPQPGEGQVLVRVKAAGVGPWDAWVRTGQSALHHPLPVIPGSDLSGVIAGVGPGVCGLNEGEAVFGVTNGQFTGAYAEYAIASAQMITQKPERLGFIEAASVPVVACTAWQMVFEHGRTDATKRVLIHGAAGGVGAYAVQLAKRAAKDVIATAFSRDTEYVLGLGADRVIDVQASSFERLLTNVDVVIDTVGGDTLDRSFAVLKSGGVLVSSVATPDPIAAERHSVRAVFFLVQVSSGLLGEIAHLIDAGQLRTSVGEVLPLADAQIAHEMLAGRPHKRGKIVLSISDVGADDPPGRP